MPPAPLEPQPRKLTDLMVKLLLGTVVGCFLALVPLSYVWFFSDVTPTQILVLLAFGVLEGIFGTFSNPQQVGRFFDSIPGFESDIAHRLMLQERQHDRCHFTGIFLVQPQRTGNAIALNSWQL